MRVSPAVTTLAFYSGLAAIAYDLGGLIPAGVVLVIVSVLIAYVSVAGGQR